MIMIILLILVIIIFTIIIIITTFKKRNLRKWHTDVLLPKTTSEDVREWQIQTFLHSAATFC